MRSFSALLLLVLSVCLAACVEKAPVKAALPVAAPKPAPPPPPPAVIEPQTVAWLPEPQAIPADALPARPPVEDHAAPDAPPATVTPVPVRRGASPRAVTAAPVPEPVTQPVTQAPLQPPVEEPGGPKPSQILRSAEDQLTSKESVAAILEDVRKQLSLAQGLPKNSTTTAAVNRVTSLVRLAEQSTAKNELRQAESLAKRALALARDVNRPR